MKTKLRFRIKKVTDGNGKTMFYPQASYYTTGIIPKRHWFGIGIDLTFALSTFNIENANLIKVNMGVSQIEQAKQIIEKWRPKLQKTIKADKKKVEYIYL